MQKLSKLRPVLLTWLGIILLMAGIYLWLGLPAMLISAGLTSFLLGMGDDIVQNRKPKEPQK